MHSLLPPNTLPRNSDTDYSPSQPQKFPVKSSSRSHRSPYNRPPTCRQGSWRPLARRPFSRRSPDHRRVPRPYSQSSPPPLPVPLVARLRRQLLPPPPLCLTLLRLRAASTSPPSATPIC